MITVGVRELKQQTSKILRRVREEGEIIEITYHGEAIARLVPMQPRPTDKTTQVWADLDQLTAEISAKWPEKVTAVEAVNEVRREL